MSNRSGNASDYCYPKHLYHSLSFSLSQPKLLLLELAKTVKQFASNKKNRHDEIKHGFIDLMLEYDNHIDIIDYKMKNITDENYLKQLNGYKKYIEGISEKEVNIYLYSILDNTLQKLN